MNLAAPSQTKVGFDLRLHSGQNNEKNWGVTN